MIFFGREICELPLQVQIVVTNKCNRSCDWCIEKENMRREYIPDEELFLKKLSSLMMALRMCHIPFNVVLTGGEPSFDIQFLDEIIDICYKKPAPLKMVSSRGYSTRAYKLGLNTNGYKSSEGFNKLDYLDYTYMGYLPPALQLGHANVRCQTCYRQELFVNIKGIQELIEESMDLGYSEILFRKTVNYWDSPSVVALWDELSHRGLEYREARFNAYDTSIKCEYRGHPIYFKIQNLETQRAWEYVNRDKITSIVMWPDAKITKSWNYDTEGIL
jgi:hypothetical protein